MVIKDLWIFLKIPPLIDSDNINTIAMASITVYNARTKHVDVDYRFIREKDIMETFNYGLFVGTFHQLADIFTKVLSTSQFQCLKDKLYVETRLLRLRLHLRGDVSISKILIDGPLFISMVES